MTQGFSKWLAPGFSFAPGDSPSSSRPPGAGVLELRPDLDQVEALAPERGELWARLQSVTFLTDDEKRAVIGYEALSPAPGDSPSFAPSDSAARSRPEGAGVSSAPSDSAAGSRPEGAGVGPRAAPNAVILNARAALRPHRGLGIQRKTVEDTKVFRAYGASHAGSPKAHRKWACAFEDDERGGEALRG